MKITLGEKEYDLSAALPVTIGDLRRLKKEYNGVQLKDLQSMDVDIIAAVMLMLARKIDPAITAEMIDTISLQRLEDVANFLATATMPDIPTSGSSTS